MKAAGTEGQVQGAISMDSASQLRSDVTRQLSQFFCSHNAEIVRCNPLKGFGNAEVWFFAGNIVIAIYQHGGSLSVEIDAARESRNWKNLDTVISRIDREGLRLHRHYNSLSELNALLSERFAALDEFFARPNYVAELKALIPRLPSPPRKSATWQRVVLFTLKYPLKYTIGLPFVVTNLLRGPTGVHRRRTLPLGRAKSLEQRVDRDLGPLLRQSGGELVSSGTYWSFGNSIVAYDVGPARFRIVMDRGSPIFSIAPKHLPRDWTNIYTALRAIGIEANWRLTLAEKLRPIMPQLLAAFSLENYPATRAAMMTLEKAVEEKWLSEHPRAVALK
jgi:hypothetical protein